MPYDDGAFEARMRAGEWYHGLRLLPGAWAVLRADGRSFTRLTASAGYARPFDERFRDRMVGAARALLEELQALYAYTESDEISVLVPPHWDQFDRSVEKAVSISAGIASAAFTASDPARPGHFDARVWLGVDVETVVDYFRWRQADAARCCLNTWCYWKLREEGRSVAEATALLDGKGFGWKNEFLFQRGQNFDDLPAWQRRGIGLFQETYTRDAVDRRTGAPVQAVRRRVREERELPMKAEYDAFIRRLCEDTLHRAPAVRARSRSPCP